MQWNDIKDAPRDGTEVLLSIRWSDVPVIAWSMGECWNVDTSNSCTIGDGHVSPDFTNGAIEGWMPLPVPKWKMEQGNQEDQEGAK